MTCHAATCQRRVDETRRRGPTTCDPGQDRKSYPATTHTIHTTDNTDSAVCMHACEEVVTLKPGAAKGEGDESDERREDAVHVLM